MKRNDLIRDQNAIFDLNPLYNEERNKLNDGIKMLDLDNYENVIKNWIQYGSNPNAVK